MSDQEVVLAGLITDLSQPRKSKRAASELVRLGRSAVPALVRKLMEDDGEPATQISSVLRQIADATPELAPLVQKMRSGDRQP